MLLAVDIGNTHMVLGLFDGKRLQASWRIQTNRGSTSDELAIMLSTLLQLRRLRMGDVSGVIIGSVVPPLESAWEHLSRDYLGCKALHVKGSKLDTGVIVRTDYPGEVGADRIINSAAGFARYQQALIIVDFGTAITLDCVSERGEYIGGAIAPGLGISFDALIQQTAKLPRINPGIAPEKAIGTNTESALRSGLLYGFGGLVEGLVQRMLPAFAPCKPIVIATGGMAPLIAPFAPSIESVDPMLTLEGLRIIYERNH